MPLDGACVSNIVYEINELAKDGRIDKIHQPEKDEILINMRAKGKNLKLMLSCSASCPRINFTDVSKKNPMNAPLFAMVLRKHLTGGKILGCFQPNFERIIELHIESMNELGDLSTKRLIIEIMGKHSNIILVDEKGTILDSAKRITHEISAIREVLPGKSYDYPQNQQKLNPLNFNKEDFSVRLNEKKISEDLYQIFSGISPQLSKELCFLANVNADKPSKELSTNERSEIINSLESFAKKIELSEFSTNIYFDNGKITDFSSIDYTMFRGSEGVEKKPFDSVSACLEFFYGEKDQVTRLNQKTVDIRKILTQNLDRCAKKRKVYEKTSKDIENRDKFRVFGELLTANIYAVEKGAEEFTTQNFYSETLEEITIPLDKNLTASENAQRFFKRYNKEKRTFLALKTQVTQNNDEINYLESLLEMVKASENEADIEEMREELRDAGFLKRKKLKHGQKPKKAKPLHFLSSDGFSIFVGKNNRQNDELTLKFAEFNDIWLHAKDMPGSHVIIKTGGKEVPNETLSEAANLAAFYSKGKGGSHVPIDYTIKKNVKKPNGAKPGMVIYDKYQTAFITTSEESVSSLNRVLK